MAFCVAMVERAEGRSGSAGAEEEDVVDARVVDCGGVDVGRVVDVLMPAPAPARSQGFGGDGVAIVCDVVGLYSSYSVGTAWQAIA